MQWVKRDPDKENVFWPTDEMKARTWVSDESIYERATADPESFWAERAEDLHWFNRWDTTYEYAPQAYKWFVGGKVNLSYNSLDRHIEEGRGENVALIWEP